MVDRGPRPKWTDGHVTLMGDAAHPAYPVGSNGASQAIVDARLVGLLFQKHDMTPQALEAFENIVRPQMTKVVSANRSGGGPDGVMQLVEDRCGGRFESINDMIPHTKLATHDKKYKALVDFGIKELNKRSPLLILCRLCSYYSG